LVGDQENVYVSRHRSTGVCDGMREIPESFRTRLRKRNFLANVMMLTGGTALGQGLVVLTSPLITRLYTPKDLGVLAVYISILAILVIVASLRYEMAIPLPKEDEIAANLLATCFLIMLGMSLLSGLGVWLLGEQIMRWTHSPALKPYLWLLPLSLLGAGAYRTLNYWAIRKKAFTHIAKTKLSQSVGQVITQLGLGLMKLGPLGLILGDVVGRVGGSGTLAALLWRQDGEAIKRVSFSEMRRAVRRYWRFPILSSTAALINSVGLQLPPLLLAAFYGAEVAGWFALGQRVLGIPITLLGTSVAQVFLAESAKIVKTCPEKMPGFFSKLIINMLLPGLPLAGLLALIAPWLFLTLFGKEWVEAGVYLRILSPMFLLQFLANPTGGTLDVLERQGLASIRELIRICLTSGAIILAGIFNQAPVRAITFLSIAGSIGYFIYAFISWIAIKNFLISNDRR